MQDQRSRSVPSTVQFCPFYGVTPNPVAPGQGLGLGHPSGMSAPLAPPLPSAPATVVFDQSLRRAFAAMSADDKAAWHIRYCAQEGAEPRVWVLLECTERELRAAGEAVTIHALWVHLADRAGHENDLDVRAAAGLAGMAMELRAG